MIAPRNTAGLRVAADSLDGVVAEVKAVQAALRAAADAADAGDVAAAAEAIREFNRIARDLMFGQVDVRRARRALGELDIEPTN